MKDLSKISLLIDFYGNLLTKKQYAHLVDYYFNDLSLNEIASQENVSKNAIYDSIKKSENELLKYEQKLNFIDRFLKRVKLYEQINDKKIREQLIETEMVKLWKSE